MKFHIFIEIREGEYCTQFVILDRGDAGEVIADAISVLSEMKALASLICESIYISELGPRNRCSDSTPGIHIVARESEVDLYLSGICTLYLNQAHKLLFVGSCLAIKPSSNLIDAWYKVERRGFERLRLGKARKPEGLALTLILTPALQYRGAVELTPTKQLHTFAGGMFRAEVEIVANRFTGTKGFYLRVEIGRAKRRDKILIPFPSSIFLRGVANAIKKSRNDSYQV